MYENNKEIVRVLREFVEISEDNQSTFKLLVGSKIFTPEEALNEVCGMLSAGEMTIWEAFNEALFELGKHNDVILKCQNELRKFSKTPFDLILDEEFQNIEYLNQVVKEVFRMSTPGIRSSGYKAYQTIKLSTGVVIPKGTIVAFGCGLSHHY